MGEADLVQALLEAVAAGDDEAAEGLAQKCAGRTHLLPALRPLLYDSDKDRRWWAVRTVALIGGPDAVPLLLARLGDEDEPTRCAAALGLGHLQAAEAVPDLVDRLSDTSGWVRDSAADGLALVGAPALPALIAAMDDPRDPVRVRAASALRRILVPLNPRGTRIDIKSVQGQAIGVLFKALNDRNYLVHEHAYEALDQMGLLDILVM